MSQKRIFYLGLPLASGDTLAATEEVLLDQEAGVLIDEALAPRRLLYARGKGAEVEVRVVDLPGVVTELAPRREERVWTLREGGVEIPLPDYELRTWTEEVDPGVEVPLGSGHVLAWARERAGRALRSDGAAEVLGVVGLVAGPLLAALGGDVALAMVQVHAAAFVGCIVGLAQMAAS